MNGTILKGGMRNSGSQWRISTNNSRIPHSSTRKSLWSSRSWTIPLQFNLPFIAINFNSIQCYCSDSTAHMVNNCIGWPSWWHFNSSNSCFIHTITNQELKYFINSINDNLILFNSIQFTLGFIKIIVFFINSVKFS